ncbi:MAG: hypothetical protein HZA23_08230 [Nitrospirae bacterium]|nr:hypothetical protein [Nitrospirota bacterium]
MSQSSLSLLLAILLLTAGSATGEGAQKPSDKERVIVKINSDLFISEEEVVDTAITIGGNAVIAGEVRGNVVAVGGDVVVRPTALVSGEAVAIGGRIFRDEGSVVEGELVEVLPQVNLRQIFAFLPSWLPGRPWVALFQVIYSLVLFLVFLALALLVEIFLPRQVTVVAQTLRGGVWMALVVGAGALAAFLPLVILVALTIIGIPLVPILFLFVSFGLLMGLVAVTILLGQRLLDLIRRGEHRPSLTVSLGAICLGLVYLLPFLGGIALLLAAVIGFGAVMRSRFGTISPSPASGGAPAPAVSSDPTLAEK